MQEELKPCPFCGGTPRANDCDIGPGYQTSSVTCKCGASVGKCDLTATAVWNTRHESAKPDSTSGGDGKLEFLARQFAVAAYDHLEEEDTGLIAFVNDNWMRYIHQARYALPFVQQPLSASRAAGVQGDVAERVADAIKRKHNQSFEVQAQAALAAIDYPVAQGWQPIETAPRDGTHIILLTSDWGAVEGWWDASVMNFYKSRVGWASYDPANMHGDWVSWWNETDGKERRLFCGQTPHHWMHLPAPPSA